MSTERSAEPVETIILVHGTLSTSPDLKGAWWWPGSLFCSELESALELRGLAARCWGHVELPHSRALMLMGQTLIGPGSPTSHFSWSGKNLESERRLAAEFLQKYLTDLELDSRVRKYYLIAHSHGGNVVRRAIRDIKRAPFKLGGTIFLGTPFLGFDDEGAIRNILRRINWPIVLLFTILSVISALSYDTLYDVVRLLSVRNDLYIFGVLFGFVAALVLMFIDYYEQTWSPIRHVPGVNLVFQGDEAIGLLKKCAAMALEPHILVHELFRDGPSMNVGRKESLLSSISRVRLVGKLLEAFTMLCFVILHQPYKPQFRLFFGSRLRGLRQSFLYFKENPPVFDTAGIVGPGAIVAPYLLAAGYLLFLPIDLAFGAIDWLIHVASRMSIWLSVRSVANAAFGIDILGSRFQWKNVAEPPEHVTTLVLPPEAQARALAEMGSLDRVRASVGQALESSDLIGSVDAVKTALHSTDLLHSRYYQDQYVIECIADLLFAARAGQLSTPLLLPWFN